MYTIEDAYVKISEKTTKTCTYRLGKKINSACAFRPTTNNHTHTIKYIKRKIKIRRSFVDARELILASLARIFYYNNLIQSLSHTYTSIYIIIHIILHKKNILNYISL